jgi:predicted nucleic acid-binding protein
VPTSGNTSFYLDSSALVKLVDDEIESDALRAALGDRLIVSCSLARTEVMRAARRKTGVVVAAARAVLNHTDLIQLDDELLDLAGELETPLRSLDSIHLAAAMELGDELEAVVTYDSRMASAAKALGLTVVTPA